MVCDLCAKNQATVHLTEIIDEQMNELHLCEECARKKSAQMESQFGLNDLLAGLADMSKETKKEAQEAISVKCANCGLTYGDFKKVGRLGCSECYITFKKHLAPLLKRIHGSIQHTGKSPVKTGKVSKKKADMQEMRIKLQKAVESEAFEEAARLRDQIKELEGKDSEIK